MCRVCWVNTSVPDEIKRREVGLDPPFSPEEIMSMEVELGCESWTSFASGCSWTAVQRKLSLWLCPTRQLKQQLRSALVAAQWRGDTALTLPLFWRRSTVSPVFFRAVSAVEPSLSRPLPPLSPSLISNLASVDVKQHGHVYAESEPTPLNMGHNRWCPAYVDSEPRPLNMGHNWWCSAYAETEPTPLNVGHNRWCPAYAESEPAALSTAEVIR